MLLIHLYSSFKIQASEPNLCSSPTGIIFNFSFSLPLFFGNYKTLSIALRRQTVTTAHFFGSPFCFAEVNLITSSTYLIDFGSSLTQWL